MAGQVWATANLGGNHAQPRLTERLRHNAQPLFKLRQFIDAQEAIGKGSGDTFNFAKAGNVQTQGGTLVETSTIPETQFITNIGTATINEYGNSVPWTGKVDALGQFEIPATTERKLRDDLVKVLESAAGAQYAASDYIAVMSATNNVVFTTDGTATATANSNLTGANVRSIVDYMRRSPQLIPMYDGENYICVSSVTALSGLHADTAAGGWQDISKYTEAQVTNVFAGTVGRFYKTIFVEETGYLSDTIGTNTAFGQAVFFGADAVYEAVSIPEEIRTKIPQDFGRDQGLAWYALLGFQKVWEFDVDGEEHIVFVTSA